MSLSLIRGFFVTLALLFLAPVAEAKDFLVYFGTYTNALSQGIYVSRLNADTGKISPPELAVATPNPCFLAVSSDAKFLYAANGVKGFSDYAVSNGGAVSAFAIGKDGRLTLLNQKCSGGVGPCHVSVDATGKVLFVANYGDGSVKTFRLETNGAIGESGTRAARQGRSINTNRQTSAHAHFIAPDPANRFALVCDLGTDEIISYPFNPATAELAVSKFEVGGVPAGAGARHLVFGRDGTNVYVLNEMGCSVSRFILDGKGRLYPYETTSALPDGVSLQNNFTGAEIRIHPTGKFLYATIRGHDSVTVFAVDETNGSVKFVQNISSGGKVPRGLGIDPTGRWLFAGNQKSDNVGMFSIDETTGKIAPMTVELKIGSPVDVTFVPAD